MEHLEKLNEIHYNIRVLEQALKKKGSLKFKVDVVSNFTKIDASVVSIINRITNDKVQEIIEETIKDLTKDFESDIDRASDEFEELIGSISRKLKTVSRK